MVRTFVLLFLLGAAHFTAYAQAGLDVIYVNGVNTERDEAARTLRAFRQTVLRAAADANEACPKLALREGPGLSISNVYNPSGLANYSEPGQSLGERFRDYLSGVSKATEITETIRSKEIEEQWAPLFSAAQDDASRVEAARQINSAAFQEPSTFLPVIEEVRSKAAASLIAGRKVVLIAHSQGGLILNRVYLKLLAQLSSLQMANLRVIHVGSAALPIADHYSMVFRNDAVVGGPDSLLALGGLLGRFGACPASGCLLNVNAGEYEVDGSGDLKNHAFETAYLGAGTVNEFGHTAGQTFRGMLEGSMRSLLSADCSEDDLPSTAGLYVGLYREDGAGAGGVQGELELLVTAAGNIIVFTPETGDGSVLNGTSLVTFTGINPFRYYQGGLTAEFSGIVEGKTMSGRFAGTVTLVGFKGMPPERFVVGPRSITGTWGACLKEVAAECLEAAQR